MLRGSIFDEIVKKTGSQCLGTGMTPFLVGMMFYVRMATKATRKRNFTLFGTSFLSFQRVTLESRKLNFMKKSE
ncbi:hypothetical protein [Wolbachia endosymbiont (group A) of Agelastica alni]|uniref:hypothetical protein n=1 Tax=Wolbachia endosymbiont (group A) of Agelastica alni TaxID=3066130 RepID=UPI003132D4DF